ncbi:MAG: response regulator transcription factor [Candidatus Eremiobacteraeota bacterium]|nr:response regulator transcription factor [Candidatus Eremiobacteraeota bacterium]MCW5867747.1 response regulator transcription factor [Candidatus Eremiobacteraeota bacterium]
MNSPARILIIDDEKNIVEALRYNLDREGFETLYSYDGLQGLELARSQLPDLIISDWMLPGLTGLELCRRLSTQEETRHIPIILLTVRSDETDKVLGLEMGAHDYVTKPFSTREMVARVKAALRRQETLSAARAQPEMFTLGPLKVDWARHRALLNDEPLELTSKEFHLLKALAEAKGRVLSREQLLDQVWDYEQASNISTRTVDLHVSQLRRKLGPLSKQLVTVKNAGYRLDS